MPVTLHILKNNQLSMAIRHGTFASRSLKSQPALLNSGAEVLRFTQVPPLLNSTILQSLEERLPLTFTSHMSVLMKYCRTASPCHLLDHLGQEFAISAYQKPPSCSDLADLSLQQIKETSEVKVSLEDHGM